MKMLLATCYLPFAVLLVLCLIVPVAAQSWEIETVDSEGNAGMYTSLAFDSSGNPHISYFDNINYDLKYTSWDGTNWQTETVDFVGPVGTYTSLALDSSGNPHISYYDLSNCDLKYTRWDGSTWQTETVDSAGDVGRFTSLALDSSGDPHISYYDDTNGDLKYTRWYGSSWQVETVDSDGWVGHRGSLALDSSGNPHISYYSLTNHDLKYTRWDGSAWQTETVDSAGDVGGFTSLALDPSSNPHISYYDYHNKDLKYTRWDGSAWQTETVDSAGDVGEHTSLVLDSSGNPHISYYYDTNKDLKYACWDGSTWQTKTVDSVGDVGEYNTSLALDSSGNSHISYYDDTNKDLKYAWWNTPPGAFSLTSPPDGATVDSWPLADWEDSTDDYPGIVTYDLWYSTDDTFSTYDEISDLTASEYQFSDTELNRNTTYYWKVVATDSYDETWSTETDWSFTVANVAVDSVELASQPTDDGVLLSWSIVGDEPTSVRVLRSVDENLPVVLSGELSGSETKWLDASTEAGVEYAYYLQVTELDGTVTCFGPSEVAVPVATSELTLSDPYPNPTSDVLTVSYELASAGSVSLSVYDLSGRLVETLVAGEQTAGRHSVNWNSSEEATGVYLLRLEANGEAITKRAVISR